MPDKKFSLLRPEAQPFNIDCLSKSQKDAVLEIIDKIVQACNAIKNMEQEETSHPKIRAMPLADHNPNRIALLSGGRGSGKTSVLFTLMKALKMAEAEENEFWGHLKEEGEIYKKVKSERLFERVVMLKTLEMEPLPDPTNLLAAILTRIEDAIGDRKNGCPISPCGSSSFCHDPEGHDALLEFSRLKQDVAQAWNGNLRQRAGSLDSDVYGLDVLKAEFNRLRLNERLEGILELIDKRFFGICGKKKTLFVLSVDDFDMNPERCLELVGLIRLINVPRLFTIILGDRRIISHVVNMSVVAKLAKIGSDEKVRVISHKVPYDECRLGHEISANTVRKLFPWSHAVRLMPMEWYEVLDFNPNGYYSKRTNQCQVECKQTIRDLCSKIPIVVNTGYQLSEKKISHPECLIGGLRISNLYDMLSIQVKDLVYKPDLETDESSNSKGEKPADLDTDESSNSKKEKMAYLIAVLFKMPPRHLQDLWRRFQTTIETYNETGSRRSIELTHAIFKETAREGRDLTMEISEHLAGTVRRDCAGELEFDTSHLKLVYAYGAPIFVRQADTCIGLKQPKSWTIKLTGAPGQEKEGVVLHDSTAASLVLLHDIMALSQPSPLIGFRLLKRQLSPQWAYTQWPIGNCNGGIRVPWALPPWQTVFEQNLLRRSWEQVWLWIGEVKIIMTQLFPEKEFFEQAQASIKNDLEKKYTEEVDSLVKKYREILSAHDEKETEAISELKKDHEENLAQLKKDHHDEINQLDKDQHHLLDEFLSEYLVYLWMKIITRILAGKEVYDLKSTEYDSSFIDDAKNKLGDAADCCLDLVKSLEKGKELPGHLKNKMIKYRGIWSRASEQPSNQYELDETKKIQCSDVCVKDVLTILELVKMKPEMLEFRRFVEEVNSLTGGSLKSELEGLKSKCDAAFEKIKDIHKFLNCIKLIALPHKEALENHFKPGIEEKIIGAEQWKNLIGEIDKLICEKSMQYPRRERVISGWIADIACILAPESDIPEPILKHFFLYGERLENEMSAPDIANNIRWMRAKVAVTFFDKGAVAMLKNLFEPKLIFKGPPGPAAKAEPPAGPIENRARINIIHNGLLCPLVEDIFSLSKLTEDLKSRYYEDLKTLINHSES